MAIFSMYCTLPQGSGGCKTQTLSLGDAMSMNPSAKDRLRTHMEPFPRFEFGFRVSALRPQHRLFDLGDLSASEAWAL